MARFLLVFLAGLVGAAAPRTPALVLTAAPAADWRALDPRVLLVMDLASGGRVVILLSDDFAPRHVANISALARAHWYDGLAIERVQDDYVAQWGDGDGARKLPPGMKTALPAEYERPDAGLALTALPYRDTYADRVGVVGGLPVGESGGQAWPVHCYGTVGVGRDLTPDNGNGTELYAVIGQAPRALDRNIAVVGRVVEGMSVLASLPRGQGDMGFYAAAAQRVPIRQVRLAADLPSAARPKLEMLDAGSASYRAWLAVRANRRDTFYLRPAGALDVCNALPPVRAAGHG